MTDQINVRWQWIFTLLVRLKRQPRVVFGIVAGLSALIVVIVIVGHQHSHARTLQSAGGTESKGPNGATGKLTTVKVIHPKRNGKELVRSITQPAFIEGFYHADLMSHVAGEVKSIAKNIGDSVTQGEVLIVIDAPDLWKDVEQKAAPVEQAQQDLRSAEANVKVIEAAEKTAQGAIAEREADVERCQAKERYLNSELTRFRLLAQRDAVVANIVDEKQLEAESATAALKSAQAAVETARNEWERAKARSNESKIDVEVRRARIGVATADRERAEVVAEFSKIRAPFDGTIIGRYVNPGTFVQNASTGKPSPLLSVVQTDVVTAVMWVPEREAPFVNKDTDAILKLDALNGQDVRTKIDRLSNWLDPDHSRDMRIEIDIKNDSPQKAGTTEPAAPLIRPGMYGNMTLILKRFETAYLLPASAVFQRNGKSCILEVQERRAHLVPVRIDFEDGATVIVVKLTDRDPAGGEVAVNLTGQEAVVFSGQSEMVEGQEVNPVDATW